MDRDMGCWATLRNDNDVTYIANIAFSHVTMKGRAEEQQQINTKIRDNDLQRITCKWPCKACTAETKATVDCAIHCVPQKLKFSIKC